MAKAMFRIESTRGEPFHFRVSEVVTVRWQNDDRGSQLIIGFRSGLYQHLRAGEMEIAVLYEVERALIATIEAETSEALRIGLAFTEYFLKGGAHG